MKLSHLSLAILSAIALAACGGSSSDDHTTDPNANKPGATDQTPKQPEDKKDEDKKDETAKEDDAKIVDPTGDQVVDKIKLAETSTVASQQYLRGKASQFDRIANPNEPASATVLSGLTLDKQNPQLTNIVIGRIDDKNSKGERVQVAFYAGSDSNQMRSVLTGAPPLYQSLQEENAPNALVGGRKEGIGSRDYNSQFELNNAAKSGYILGSYLSMKANPVIANDANVKSGGSNPPFDAYTKAYNELQKAYHDYEFWLETYKTALAEAKAKKNMHFDQETITINGVKVAIASSFSSAARELNNKIVAYETALTSAEKSFADLGIKLNKGTALEYVDGTVSKADIEAKDASSIDMSKFNELGANVIVPKNSDLEKYGAGLYWYATKDYTNKAGWGDYVDPVKGVVGAEAGDKIHDNGNAGLPTTGLVGIYKSGNKLIVRGSDDKNVRTTRIFGHYYLDPGSEDQINLNSEGFNSWNSARTFITGVDKDNNPNQYGLGAAPITLNHVQYGRVTATIDDNDAAKYAGTSGWVKKHQDFANRDPKYANDADDFYFYRGTNATSIEDMAKLPTDATIAYQGHALMYGIDNSFHGAGQELPNAFGNQQSYGLGNFVKANLNMGSKKFDGYVYNVWGSPASAAVKEDKLVEFSGDVTGNTVIGTANLAYDTSKTGDLRASFYGAGAEEVGGAINSVKREDPYGPIGWGGVFGAQRTTSGSSAWLVSSEKK